MNRVINLSLTILLMSGLAHAQDNSPPASSDATTSTQSNAEAASTNPTVTEPAAEQAQAPSVNTPSDSAESEPETVASAEIEQSAALGAGAGVALEPAPDDTVYTVAASESEAPDAEEPHVLAWTENFKLGGGAILYYYQPTEGGNSNFSLFFANLVLDGQWGDFGLHVEPRIRDTRLRPFFEGPAWVQEAYGSYKLDPVTLKIGKIYKRSGGLFWDNSFYGNVQVYDGLKLDPNYGASIEGSVGDELGLDFAAQFFIVDGRTNVSLQGRDTISIPDARRRHIIAGRLEPFVKFGTGQLRLGLSGEHFKAEVPTQEEQVTRLSADAKFTYDLEDAGAVGVWGEFLHQDGRHVFDHPAAGGASGDNSYFLVGLEYSIWRLTARYNVSHVTYADVDTTEILHVPALGIKAQDHLYLLGEFVVWRQTAAGVEIPYDTSLNVTLRGNF